MFDVDDKAIAFKCLLDFKKCQFCGKAPFFTNNRFCMKCKNFLYDFYTFNTNCFCTFFTQYKTRFTLL